MSRDHGSLQKAALAALRPVFGTLWRIRAVGIENIPTSGPAILAPNHTSVIDSFFLPAVLPRRITYVGKAEYLDDWKTRRLFPALGMIPIDRSGGDAAARALDTAAGLLEDGELFGIYPEGTRARDGFLHKGHTGAARLSLRTGAPIVPVGILGTRSIQPPDVPYPMPFRPVEIRFGRPIRPAASEDVADTRMRLRQITDELMFEIRALTGQDYVNDYATKSKQAATETLEKTIDPTMPERRSSADVLRAAAV
ncbi:MAG: 1-acyl-sn-glycerol-3-phosphate acyltransferase [Candidatus Aldehydirespiratoraceae bacterium]|jgi:1-acyl-sn-glycerol-3-phosphate acyltransferase